MYVCACSPNLSLPLILPLFFDILTNILAFILIVFKEHLDILKASNP